MNKVTIATIYVSAVCAASGSAPETIARSIAHDLHLLTRILAKGVGMR